MGSSAWFNKLKGYLEEYGLKSDEGLPALFYRRPEKGKAGMVVLSHVDDMELYATKEEFQELIEFLRKKKLKIKVEGPLNVHEGSMSFLKRGFSAVNDGDVEITMNSKYIEGLVDALELDQSYPKKLPCPADNGRAMQAKKGGMDPLSEEDHHTYRKGVGILLYLAPERPDLMYVLKKLSTKLASPVEADMELLRHAAKYLKGTPDVSLIHKKSYPGRSFIEERNERKEEEVERNVYEQESLLEIVTDSDWAADRESRQSVSCGAIMLNGNLIHFQSKRQKSIALSSREAETIAATSILSEGVFLKALLTRILGKEPNMAVLVALGEAKKFSEEEEIGDNEGSTLCMKILIVLIGCVSCYLIPVAAVLRIKLVRVEKERRKEGMAEEHSNVMEQRVEELAEMREGAMARRENLLQENAPEKKEESEAPEGEKEEEKGSEDEQKASSEKAESYSESYYSSSSEEEEGPKEAEKPKEGEGHKTEDYILLSEEGLWAVTRQSALLDEENRMILEGENALNMDFVRSERLKQIYDDFQTRMKQPTEQLPDSFGSQVEKWGAEAMDLLTDLRDSEEIIHGDRDEIEQRLDGARKKFEKKKEEIAESLKEADGLKKEMDEAEKEFQEATEEVKDFQISKDVVKGVVVMMRTAGEVMKALIDERPEFGRLFEKKRERVSLYDLIKKKREAESEAEPMGKEPMGKASEKKGVTMQPKTKAMPKRVPSPLREKERARAKEAKDRRKPKMGPKEAAQLLFLWGNDPQGNELRGHGPASAGPRRSRTDKRRPNRSRFEFVLQALLPDLEGGPQDQDVWLG